MIIPSKASELTWIANALAELGQKEMAGSQQNPRIIQYHAATMLGAREDEVPWCASFVCFCLSDRGTHSAAAESFRRYGIYMDAPIFGCIVVLSRGEGKFHVGFYVGKRNGKIMVLGGNQHDCVCISDFEPSAIVACRWPIAA